ARSCWETGTSRVLDFKVGLSMSFRLCLAIACCGYATHNDASDELGLNSCEMNSARAADSVGSRGGEGVACTSLAACPLRVPPAEVGCFRLRPVIKAAELG